MRLIPCEAHLGAQYALQITAEPQYKYNMPRLNQHQKHVDKQYDPKGSHFSVIFSHNGGQSDKLPGSLCITYKTKFNILNELLYNNYSSMWVFFLFKTVQLAGFKIRSITQTTSIKIEILLTSYILDGISKHAARSVTTH